ncbi:hypothetical protein GOODEAATRI_011691 [Goodea atripinnis]|uniref:Uncharacterized protein n=1 Tax=Goodea atripinnis TaxID=208336 RepID=A0ABV0PXI1_9TELE
MIPNPPNPTEKRRGQQLRNPGLLIREECCLFRLDSGSNPDLSIYRGNGTGELDFITVALNVLKKASKPVWSNFALTIIPDGDVDYEKLSTVLALVLKLQHKIQLHKILEFGCI